MLLYVPPQNFYSSFHPYQSFASFIFESFANHYFSPGALHGRNGVPCLLGPTASDSWEISQLRRIFVPTIFWDRLVP